MLKPIEALLAQAERTGMATDDLKRKQDKLLDDLLHPYRNKAGDLQVQNRDNPQFRGEALDAGVTFTVSGPWAHGNVAGRILGSQDEQGRRIWALQTWSAEQEGWVTKVLPNTYQSLEDLHEDAQRMFLRTSESAFNLWPPLFEATTMAKWGDINSTEHGALECLFDSRAKLAEFWYETKEIKWEEGNPFKFMSDVADTFFQKESWDAEKKVLTGEDCVVPSWGLWWDEKYNEKIEAQISNFLADWGELPTPMFSGKLYLAGTKEVDSIVQYHSASNAIDHILQSGCDAVLQAGSFSEANTSIYNFDYRRDQAMQDRDQLIVWLDHLTRQVQEEKAEFVIQIDRKTFAAGSVDENGWCSMGSGYGEIPVPRQCVDAKQLIQYAADFGISEPTAKHPCDREYIYFTSPQPPPLNENDFRRCDLHVIRANGHEPRPEDYQKIADLIGAKFENRLCPENAANNQNANDGAEYG